MSQILKKSLEIGSKNEIRFEQWNTGHKKLVKRKNGETRVDRLYSEGQGLISCCCTIDEEEEKNCSNLMFTAETLNHDVTICLVMRLFFQSPIIKLYLNPN